MMLLMAEQERIRLMIVAGEASGDAHAAALVRALRVKAPAAHFEFFGATEREMRAAGVESIVRADDLAIVGLLEVGRALPRFWEAYKTLKAAARARQPDAAILVDWPDFNLPLARALHRRGIKVIYYISPQLWAWRARRVRNIRRDVDLLLAILPFEPEWYKKRGITHVEFVGHPLTGEVRPRYGRAEFCVRHNLDPSRPLIALLPGSRRKELQRILPPMIDAAGRVARERPDAQFVVALAPTRSSDEAKTVIDSAPLNGLPESVALRVAQHETREALAAADAAGVASGTATLEAALTETPLVVVYKESALNWHTLGRLIDVEHFGLVNLIAGERLATELMQDAFTGESLARELLQLLDAEHNARFRARLRTATARLGAGGASDFTAASVLRAVREWKGMRVMESGVRGQESG
ncbi:MAG TPA: lipid-A-disaccharide synthase, partial [Pyrinomonadaceae bacterium]|nr:lipid-A-disaccharide synthase [Pyrinomonadaceae bacterium]